MEIKFELSLQLLWKAFPLFFFVCASVIKLIASKLVALSGLVLDANVSTSMEFVYDNYFSYTFSCRHFSTLHSSN